MADIGFPFAAEKSPVPVINYDELLTFARDKT